MGRVREAEMVELDGRAVLECTGSEGDTTFQFYNRTEPESQDLADSEDCGLCFDF